MEQARKRSGPDLGIDRPAFSDDKIRRIVKKVRELEEQARKCIRAGGFELARTSMEVAQEIWGEDLGIDKPTFSSHEINQIVEEVQRLASERPTQDPYFRNARWSMEQAQKLWGPDLGIDMPAFSDIEIGEMVKEVRGLEKQARNSMRAGCFELARRSMEVAQEVWGGDLGIDMPTFSSHEINQMEKDPPIKRAVFAPTDLWYPSPSICYRTSDSVEWGFETIDLRILGKNRDRLREYLLSESHPLEGGS
jgi:hypothetical protein